MPVENLWGTSWNSTAPTVTNGANMVDSAFNDVVADIELDNLGQVTWDVIDNTAVLDYAEIDAIELQVRFYGDTADLSGGAVNLEIYDGTTWHLLTTYGPTSNTPVALTTVVNDVKALLDTLVKIDACQVRFDVTTKKNNEYLHVDEARLVVRTRNKVNVFDLSTIAEAVQRGPNRVSVFDSVAIVEDANVALDTLYINEFDSVSIEEWVYTYLDVLHVFGFDDHYVLVTEHVDVVDLMVEIGVVSEYLYVSEYVAVYPTELFIDVYDEVSVTESVVVTFPDLLFSVYDDITTLECVMCAYRLSIDVADSTSLVEDVVPLLPELNIYRPEYLEIEEYVEVLDIVVEVFTVFDELSVLEDIAATTYADLREVMWGQTVVSSWPVTDKQNAEDQAYNDSVAVVHTDLSNGNVRWSAIQDTEELNDDFIVSASVTVRFRFDAAIVSGYVELILNNGDGDTILETFDSGNYFTTLTTKGYDVTAQLNTRKRINNAVVMLRGYSLNSPNIELDEVQILLAKRRPFVVEDIPVVEDVSIYLPELFASAYDDTLITEVAQILDNVIEVGVVPDFVSLVEAPTLQVDHLYTEASDDVSVQDIVTPDLVVASSVYDATSVLEDVAVVLEPLVIDVNDSASVTEDATTSLGKDLSIFEVVSVVEDIAVVVAKGVDVGELVLVDETAELMFILLADVYDEVASVEDAVLQIDSLFLLASDDVGVVDVPTMNDLVIELGPTIETVATTEDIGIVLEHLNSSVYDSVATAENIDVVIEALVVSVFDSLTVTEYATTHDLVIELFAFDSVSALDVFEPEKGFIAVDEVGVGGALIEWVSVEEYIAAVLPELNVDVADTLSIDEYIQMHDIIVELLVSDEVTVSESFQILVAHIMIQVHDEVSTAETVFMLDIIVEMVDAVESLTVQEYVALVKHYFPLFFETVAATEYVSVGILIEIEAGEDIAVDEAATVDEPLVWKLFPVVFTVVPRERVFEVDKTGVKEFSGVLA